MDVLRIQYTQKLVDGATILIRPWRAEDIKCWQKAVQQLSDKTLYNRFFTYSQRKIKQQVPHLINVDYENHMALCAMYNGS